jgi:CspA family cold shock protein
MNTGTVKFFNEEKGFGFIKNNDTEEELFVHISALDGAEIKEGDTVQYTEVEGKNGKTQAADVSVIESA